MGDDTQGTAARDVLTGATSTDAMAAVLVGYLVTHSDGYQVRLDADYTRAALYASRNHGMLEPIYVLRPKP